MKSEISKLRNLGSKSEKILNEVGIYDLRQIKQLGPEETFARVKKKYPKVSICLMYALIGAVYDKHWVEVCRALKGRVD